ncbi:Heme O synthase, protoheme IX farnesyltransferase COX10-CtaB [hydrothermal vent metagenome]|uniref:Protoheme IX farnesyltransferase n=1 Tax=hydrothermal vent metagenome TaxID=652676 RepID=A0A3B0SZM8_9ZZZZ
MQMGGSTITDATAATGIRNSRIGDYFALLKPRVMSLVVFTAATGLFAAPGELAPLNVAAAIVLIAIGGGASGALNMWWEADIDAKMRRTAGRPVPAGRLTAAEARNFGLALSALSVILLGLVSNLAAAGLLAFTIFFYVVIYTVWLKRATPWNIVIGGAAGAFPPMIGWVVVTGSIAPEAVLMFALVFIWTPPHFWSLALFMKDDYTRARVPMLTVTHGRPETRRQILIYTLLLVPVSVVLAFSSVGGPVYLLVALGLNLAFVRGALGLSRREETVAIADGFAAERRFFRLSLLYLSGLFVGLLIEIALRGAGIGLPGWPTSPGLGVAGL